MSSGRRWRGLGTPGGSVQWLHELIGDVADNGDVTGIPALAILHALPRLKGTDRERLEQLINGQSRTIAVLPLLAEDLIDVERIGALIPAGFGTAHAVEVANRYGVMLATTEPDLLGIGVVIHQDDICELS